MHARCAQRAPIVHALAEGAGPENLGITVSRSLGLSAPWRNAFAISRKPGEIDGQASELAARAIAGPIEIDVIKSGHCSLRSQIKLAHGWDRQKTAMSRGGAARMRSSHSGPTWTASLFDAPTDSGKDGARPLRCAVRVQSLSGFNLPT
jgi:hypothetical protein